MACSSQRFRFAAVGTHKSTEMRQSIVHRTSLPEDSMMHLRRFCTVSLLLILSGCGAGETAATATLQAEQAKQAQQQMEQLKQQIDQANAANTQRLQDAIDQAQ
ncbi:hypothetical protein EGJ23_13245 [Pseudomonas sp. o96-267]|nr:hypothetical protein EGJ23_13245 [Pseudomonas sp. o96-267]